MTSLKRRDVLTGHLAVCASTVVANENKVGIFDSASFGLFASLRHGQAHVGRSSGKAP